MGELFGMSEWVTEVGFAVGFLALLCGYGWLSVWRAHRRVTARRPNPTEAEFLAMMAPDCSPEAALFTWQQALSYVEPRLTPHPDDLLLADLCIDDGDVTMDWPQVWAEQRGFSESEVPDWPTDWPLTVRNFARWLDLSRSGAGG